MMISEENLSKYIIFQVFHIFGNGNFLKVIATTIPPKRKQRSKNNINNFKYIEIILSFKKHTFVMGLLQKTSY